MSGAPGHLDVAVVGKANLDYLVLGPRLPKPGMSAGGDVFHEGPGGKGANQAVAAARLGAAVALIARIGKDRRGHTVLATLRAEGVDERWVVRDPEAPTGVALCQVGNGGEKQILSAAGANARLSAAGADRAATPGARERAGSAGDHRHRGHRPGLGPRGRGDAARRRRAPGGGTGRRVRRPRAGPRHRAVDPALR